MLLWIAAFCVVLSALVLIENGRRQYSSYKLQPTDKVVDLLPSETSPVFMMVLAPTTVSVYNRQPGQPLPFQFLNQRVEEIVEANPWLSGRLRTINGKTCLVYDPSHAKSQKFVHFMNGPASIFEEKLDMIEIQNTCSTIPFVKPGNECLDKDDGELFKVIILTNDSYPEKFAFVLSMSHVVGDGYTFYQLLGMLNKDSIVESLDFTRVKEVDQLAQNAMGKDEFNMFFSISLILGVILNKFRNPKANVHVRILNEAYIKDVKRKYTAENPNCFISTNDIVTSNHLNASGCSFGCMAFNFRSKLAGIHEKLAGNYINTLTYLPEDYKTPEMIRQSLGPKQYKRVTNSKLPDWKAKIMGNLALITNWTSFYKLVELPGSSLRYHAPLIDLPGAVGFNEVAVVWRLNQNVCGLAFVSRRSEREFNTDMLQPFVVQD